MIVKHYKGGLYKVLIEKTKVPSSEDLKEKTKNTNGVIRAIHTETLEEVFVFRKRDRAFYTEDASFVIYKDRDETIWARPVEDFWQWGYFRGKDELEPRFSIVKDMEFIKEYLCEWV